MKPVSLFMLIALLFTTPLIYGQEKNDPASRKKAGDEKFARHHPLIAERQRRDKEERNSAAYLDAKRKNEEEKRARHKVTEINKSDMRIGFGTLSLSTIGPAFNSLYISLQKTDSRARYEDVPTPCGIAGFDYKYFIGNKIGIGLAAALEFNTGNRFVTKRPDIPGSYNGRIITFAPEGTFVYAAYHKKLFYLSLALGYSIDTKQISYKPGNYYVANSAGITSLPDKITTNYANMYFATGIRFGGALGGFVELGLGFRGILNAGLSYKF